MRLLIALGLLLAATAQAAFDTSRFAPRALSAFEFTMRFSQRFPKKDGDEVLDPDLTALSTPVRYTGRTRELSPDKKSFIGRVARELLKHDEVAALYRREIEVTEAGLSYWVAVQEEVLPHLSRELKAGAAMRIYYHFAGVARGRQPVYLMIEFDSPRQANTASR